MDEQMKLYNALDKLNELTGLNYEVIDTRHIIDGYEIDALISIGSAEKGNRFNVEIKHELRSSQLPKLLSQLRLLQGDPSLVISQYIPKPLKQELKERQINYLETAGNAFIKTKDLFIYINDQPVTDSRLPAEGKLWNATGLKFIFAILQFSNLINQSYRKIASVAGISLGSVGPLVNEMEAEGYLKTGILNHEKNFKFIVQEERLIQKWAELFRANLRPKLFKGTYRFMNPEQYRNWDKIDHINFLWGGENAGALLTGYLTPERFTIYTKVGPSQLMKELRLIPDKNGLVEILEQFWASDYEPDKTVAAVPFLLAYAELSTSFDSRCQETAERIKKQYIEK